MSNQTTLNLNGEWSFKLTPEQTNEVKVPEIFTDTIQIPGSIEEQGFGDASDHFPIGTWKKKREYEGIAWYSKEIKVPEHFKDHDLQLHINGARWHTELWINGTQISESNRLSVPHVYDITKPVQPGTKNRVSIKVDNRMQMDLQESHIHSYHTATNWGGITGGIELIAKPQNGIQNVKVEANQATLQAIINLKEEPNQPVTIKQTVKDVKDSIILTAEAELINQQTILKLHTNEKLENWSPEHPNLYFYQVELIDNQQIIQTEEIRFGVRSFSTKDQQFLINDTPVFLNGYVDCCVFPQTGYPVRDKEHYHMQFQTAKRYGFNHVRLHGWTPPEPFWEAADEEGMLVQTELPQWSVYYRERDLDAPEDVHTFYKKELEIILKKLYHHPSFVMLAMGNELISQEGHPQLNELVEYAKTIDVSRLYTDNTGFGELPGHDRAGDFYIPTLNWHPPYHINDAAGPDTTTDYREVTKLENKPLIAHEHGQFTMYARPEEEKKYKGILEPHWLDTINASIEKKGLQSRVDEFIEATGNHLARGLKETFEKARRTPGLAGIQLLDIRDFPGQGHATVGILDVFWDSKGIISEKAFRQFSNDIVLLARSDKRTFYDKETLTAQVDVSYFGKSIENLTLEWQLTDENKVVRSGEINNIHLTGQGLQPIEIIQIPLETDSAKPLTFHLNLTQNNEALATNNWDYWIYPRPLLPDNIDRIWTNIPTLRSVLYGARFEDKIGINQHSFQKDPNVDLVISDQLSRDVIQHVVDGGTVWLMSENQQDEILTRYLPTFWNYLWFPEQQGTTMGMKIHQHPVLQRFPHDAFSNWQWFHLVNQTGALNIDSVPQIKPIIEVIDNFNRLKRLTYMFEAKVGRGKLFVTSLNTKEPADLKRPETQTLLLEIIDYLNSKQFQPTAELTMSELLGIFKVTAIVHR
ncbi:glycoside hydrolase family 2 protein [Gracilibacillus massiliensis]|uniref:glycoside hydrolase family 2 protein n=1 Tax=Gracilibacillus massiliensis TaxID=1564956 RepID=UPI00071C2581|nr:glycoside hydrolase family 2 [Gracilibacillus massiliensis]